MGSAVLLMPALVVWGCGAMPETPPRPTPRAGPEALELEPSVAPRRAPERPRSAAREPASLFGEAMAQRRPQRLAGALSPSLIREPIREARPRFQRCYQAGSGEAAGRHQVRFVIAPDGSVRSATVRARGGADEAVARCLEGVIGELHFARPPGGGVIIVTSAF